VGIEQVDVTELHMVFELHYIEPHPQSTKVISVLFELMQGKIHLLVDSKQYVDEVH